MSLFRLLPLLMIFLLSPAWFGPAVSTAYASSDSLVLEDVVLNNRDNRVQLDCGLRVEDSAPITEALFDGMNLELTCTATLSRIRTAMWDETLGVQRFRAGLKGDLLNREVVLFQDGERKVLSIPSLEKELTGFWSAIRFDLGPWSLIDPGKRYSIRINVSLKRTEIPAWVRVPLFFWSWDVVPQTTYRMEIGHLF